MSDTTLLPEVATPTAGLGTSGPARRRRLLALGLVLSVSFTQFIVTAFHYVFSHADLARFHRTQYSLLGGLITEVTSLLLLWFVLSEQGRTWKEIGLDPQWRDLGWGIALVFIAGMFSQVAVFAFQTTYLSYAGHYLPARSLHALLGAAISPASILFTLVNPLFEELIVRAYAMSEIMALGGSRGLAILVSVSVQMSYHVYQGFVHCVALTVVFAIFAIYFARTRRIGPVIVAHFWSDAYGLIWLARRSFVA